MSMIRRRLLQTALAVLPALTIAGAAMAADPGAAASPSHLQSAPMETLHMVMQEIPGPEYALANQLKNEALHAFLMGGDPAAAEAKLKAFAQEYARVAGTDPAAMEAHVMEVSAQLTALAQDPAFQEHLAQMHAAGH